jgi:hypothetical protein
MKTLMTSAEVAAMAFPGSLDPEGGFVAEASILAAQQKFLKPVLGELYDALEGHPALLSDYVKPALAQWVRFLVLPSIATQVGSTGIVAPRGQNFESVAPMSAAALRTRAKADARALTRRMVEHIEANTAEYPEYDRAQNVLSRTSTAGSIVL